MVCGFNPLPKGESLFRGGKEDRDEFHEKVKSMWLSYKYTKIYGFSWRRL